MSRPSIVAKLLSRSWSVLILSGALGVCASGIPTSTASAASAAPAQQHQATPPPGVIRSEEPVFTRNPEPARARDFRHRVLPPVEEIVVFSDSLNGLRLDSLGGWSHFDHSGQPTAWHRSNFLACQDTGWWCGIVDSSWIYDPNRAGYGNGWVQTLQNFFRTDSIPANAHVKIGFRHHFDAEKNYDYGFLEVYDLFNAWTPIAGYTGLLPATGIGCDTVTVQIPDSIVAQYTSMVPPEPMPFRFRFTSDVAYSSEDGLYAGDGWFIDNVAVTATSKTLFYDNMEGGQKNWDPSVSPPVGDYFTLQSNVLTEDLCSQNRTNVWVDWSPIYQSLVPGLDNLLNTPSVAINRSSQVSVAFDVYRSLPLFACFYYHLNFRTKNVGDADWSNWIDPTRVLYYGAQKDWARQKVTLAGAANHDSLQVQLGLKDYSQLYCDGVSSSANVYAHFDNVQVLIVQSAPPIFVVRDADLFNDTFQTTAFFKDDNFNSPLGDSAVVQVNASKGYQSGFMYYRFNGGSFSSVPLQKVSSALPTYRYADVPPGDYPANTRMDYYFAVTDSMGTTSHSPWDAVGSQTFYTASILPLKTATNAQLGCTDSLASILFVNHFYGREPQPLLQSSLKSYGYKFDVWNVLAPSSGLGNSLGGSDPIAATNFWPATDVNSLLPYSTIIWHSGDLKAFNISPQDQAVIQSWIQQPGKDRNFWITGDNVGYELATQGQEFNGFLGFTCGTRYLRDIWETLPQDTLHPVVKGVAGSPLSGRFMHVNGDCPLIDDFDMVGVSSSASSTGKAGILLSYPNTFGAATRYATDYNTFSATDSARVVFMGFSFNDIEEGGERLQATKNIVTNYFGVPACYVATGVEEESGAEAPGVPNSLAQNAPNPFNPETVIRYSVARAGPVEIRIYNVAGALVRTLVSRVHTPGIYTARWNGTDDRSRPLPSGAYFYRLESKEFHDSKKLILLR